jgi:hypothetical protein
MQISSVDDTKTTLRVSGEQPVNPGIAGGSRAYCDDIVDLRHDGEPPP